MFFLSLLFVSLGSSSPELGSAPQPALLSSAEAERTDSRPSRWDGSGQQFAAGIGGGALGTILGGVAGLAVGGALAGSHQDLSGLGMIIVGGIAGAGLGGTAGTAIGVRLAASGEYPSRGAAPAWAGSVLGVLGGALLVQVVAEHSPEDVKWGIWPGAVTLVTCSSLGAVIADRAAAKSPVGYSVAPWLPRGRPGLMARAEF